MCLPVCHMGDWDKRFTHESTLFLTLFYSNTTHLHKLRAHSNKIPHFEPDDYDSDAFKVIKTLWFVMKGRGQTTNPGKRKKWLLSCAEAAAGREWKAWWKEQPDSAMTPRATWHRRAKWRFYADKWEKDTTQNASQWQQFNLHALLPS